jgi:hypothetical protein
MNLARMPLLLPLPAAWQTSRTDVLCSLLERTYNYGFSQTLQANWKHYRFLSYHFLCIIH